MAVSQARRSSLILPVNVRHFVEKAYTRGADAVVLDLEDSVPTREKASARMLVRDSLALAGRGGAEVLVRVNNDPALLADDIDAVVHPGLDGLSIPKAESAAQIRDIVARIDRLGARARPRPWAPAPVPRRRDTARAPGRRGDRPIQRSHRHHEHRRRGLLPGAGRGALGRRPRAPLPRRPSGERLQGRRRAAHRVSWAASRDSATSPPSSRPPCAPASSAAKARDASIPTR